MRTNSTSFVLCVHTLICIHSQRLLQNHQGPPIEIDWKHVQEDKWKFDTYQATRIEPRSYFEMNVPMEIRIGILERAGVKSKDIIARTKEVKAYRVARLETQHQMYRTESHEKMEKIVRGLRNIFTDKKKKERALMSQTQHLGKLPENDDHL